MKRNRYCVCCLLTSAQPHLLLSLSRAAQPGDEDEINDPIEESCRVKSFRDACPRGLSMWVSSKEGGREVERGRGGGEGDGGVWSQLGGPWLVGWRWRSVVSRVVGSRRWSVVSRVVGWVEVVVRGVEGGGVEVVVRGVEGGGVVVVVRGVEGGGVVVVVRGVLGQAQPGPRTKRTRTSSFNTFLTKKIQLSYFP